MIQLSIIALIILFIAFMWTQIIGPLARNEILLPILRKSEKLTSSLKKEEEKLKQRQIKKQIKKIKGKENV